MESWKPLNFGLLIALTAIAAVIFVRSFTVPVKVVPKPNAEATETEVTSPALSP